MIFFAIFFDNKFCHFLCYCYSATFRHLQYVLKGQLSLRVGKVLVDSLNAFIRKLPSSFMSLLRSDQINKCRGRYIRVFPGKPADSFILFLQWLSLSEILCRSSDGCDRYLSGKLLIQKIYESSRSNFGE